MTSHAAVQSSLALCASPLQEAIDAVHTATAIYTASPVVRDVLSRLGWPGDGGVICDPSCGDGSFIDSAIRMLLDREPDCSPATLFARVEGWEFHEGAACAARLRIRSTLREYGWSLADAARSAERVVRCADFLVDGAREPRYNWICGNPPYLRITRVPQVLRDAYTQCAPAYSLSDLAYTFLDRVANVLADGGKAGLVVADRFLFNEGASELRRQLGERLTLSDVYRLDASTAFYRPKDRRAGSPPRVHPVVVVFDRGGAAGVHALDGRPIFPGVDETAIAGRRLGDIADLRLAPWLGTPGIFLVDEAVARTLPPECVVPAADGTDFDGDRLTISRYALITHAGQTPPPAVMAHLERELPRMCARGRRAPPWLPPEAWVGRFDLSTPTLLIPRIARELRPLLLPAGVLPVNHGISILQSSATDLPTLADALRSDACQQWIASRAPRLEGGYLSITTRLLRDLPVQL